MPFSLHLNSRTAEVAAELQKAMDAPGNDLAPAALAIARVEYPSLDPAAVSRDCSTAWARKPRTHRRHVRPARKIASARSTNTCTTSKDSPGNRERYDDPRNSFINEVLDRRTGIPISLAVVYLEVARRAGLQVDGVNFPGHFLLRAGAGITSDARSEVVDHRSVSRRRPAVSIRLPPTAATARRRRRRVRHALLLPATRHDIVVRMLVNLKRLYVRMRSFPQARFISTLLLGIDPSAISELRDRGLLAYHLQDFAGALRDLEEYLRLAPKSSEHGEPDLLAEQGDGDDAEGEDDSDDEEAATTRRRSGST